MGLVSTSGRGQHRQRAAERGGLHWEPCPRMGGWDRGGRQARPANAEFDTPRRYNLRPSIDVSRLLKSCAIPPVSWLTVSSFWADRADPRFAAGSGRCRPLFRNDVA
jgi:hypothetical protein